MGPLLLIIFINDLVDICGENIILYIFADDAKMYCHIKDLADKDKLQRGIERFVTWTNKWQVSLNALSVIGVGMGLGCLLYTSDAADE